MWGVFLMIQATAKNFAGLAALRAMAGAAEACSDPAFMLITVGPCYSFISPTDLVLISSFRSPCGTRDGSSPSGWVYGIQQTVSASL